MSPFLKLFLTLSSVAQAHMQLYSPPPFNASNNQHTYGPPDNELHYPCNCCGRKTEHPYRGYLSLLGTPAGAPTATWAAGSVQKWSMEGPALLGGTHYGGSCQISLSLDRGNTFPTLVSYEGNCPHRNGGPEPAGQTFNFTVPGDVPVGEAVFAWTWVNREQEFNMNCAAVLITGEKAVVPRTRRMTHTLMTQYTKTKAAKPTETLVAFNEHPEMFVADVGNGCLTPKTDAELKYPQPGEDVVKGDGAYPLQLPSGNCSKPV